MSSEDVLTFDSQEHGFELDAFFEPHVQAWLKDTESSQTQEWVSRAVGMDSVSRPPVPGCLASGHANLLDSGYQKVSTSTRNRSLTYLTLSEARPRSSSTTCPWASTSVPYT